jgi:hypothetical protein
MRLLLISLFVLLSFVSYSQKDSTSSSPNLDRIRPGVGVNALAGSSGGVAFGGHFFLRYQVLELGVTAGRKNRTIHNFKGFDRMNSNGSWIEPQVSLIVPVYGKMSVPSSNFLESGYTKIRVGYGFIETDNEFTEEFSSIGPFESYNYLEKYDVVKYQYFSLSAGIHADIENRVSTGLGLTFYNFKKVSELSRLHPTATPINGSAQLGLYAELTFLF